MQFRSDRDREIMLTHSNQNETSLFGSRYPYSITRTDSYPGRRSLRLKDSLHPMTLDLPMVNANPCSCDLVVLLIEKPVEPRFLHVVLLGFEKYSSELSTVSKVS